MGQLYMVLYGWDAMDGGGGDLDKVSFTVGVWGRRRRPEGNTSKEVNNIRATENPNKPSFQVTL